MCSRYGRLKGTWHFLLYIVRQQSRFVGAIGYLMPGTHGYCWWGCSASRQPWPVVWRWYISPWRSGDFLGVGNVLLVPILESAIRSWGYCGWTVVVEQRLCPTIGVRRRAVTISGVACVARHVWCRCLALWRSVVCVDNSGRGLR